VVGGVLSSKAAASKAADVPVVPTPAPTPAPTTVTDALWAELLSLNATFEKNLWQFTNAKSAQYQALAWIKNDTIVMTQGRSTHDLLQRYVLAVLFYATNGGNWGWSGPYLSSKDVCSWNKGSENYGVYCRSDGGSVNKLILSDNNLKGTLPWELGLLTNLEIIDLDFNDLEGSFPTDFSQRPSLKSLAIQGNWWTGTIPTELGQLLSLTYLAMYSNQMTGTIPTELGQLLALTSLSIWYMPLSGTIPTELGQLVSLQSLDISGDQLTGTIPTELGQLISLESLNIGYNQLTGTIPPEVAGIGNLTAFDGSNNALLTGSLEQSLCANNRTENNGLYVDCDNVECSCCFCCCR
jgi:hypothetical protein